MNDDDDRIAALTTWLQENAPYIDGDQKHLDDGTPERAYYNLGYLCALRDKKRKDSNS
jgi:hypothetical protein